MQRMHPAKFPASLELCQRREPGAIQNGMGHSSFGLVGPLDGIVGPRTRKALISFQRQQGLQATRQMDQRTVAALGITTGSGQEHSQIPGANTTGHGGTGTP
jgi:peptidoglycan hydrolase-like protein with peptidoglycan-binding domain